MIGSHKELSLAGWRVLKQSVFWADVDSIIHFDFLLILFFMLSVLGPVQKLWVVGKTHGPIILNNKSGYIVLQRFVRRILT